MSQLQLQQLENNRYVVNLRANCWEENEKQNQQNMQCLQIFILVLPRHLPKPFHYLVTNISFFSFFLFCPMAVFSTNLCMHMWTQKFVNVHYTKFPIYYSPLWLMIFKHLLKNLCLLFLESELYFVIWKPNRHHREKKVIADFQKTLHRLFSSSYECRVYSLQLKSLHFFR